MARIFEEDVTIEELKNRLETILPKRYEGRYDEIQPSSMGSAGLRYDTDGNVAWDTIWGSFCDLAIAGGPPHRGTLLRPGLKREIDSEAKQYGAIASEICRGVSLVTGLFVEPSPEAGWVQMYCTSAGMAGWLARAMFAENIAVRFRGLVLYLPAGPTYRIEKEVKNVVTSTAKTCHYWLEHTSTDQHWEISTLLAGMENDFPLLKSNSFDRNCLTVQQEVHETKVAEAIYRKTGLLCEDRDQDGWLALECGDVRAAVWMMRMLVVCNVLSRREDTTVFVPIDSDSDADGERTVGIITKVHDFAMADGIL